MNADELFSAFETNLSKFREWNETVKEGIVESALNDTVGLFWESVVSDVDRLSALPAKASALRRYNTVWDDFLKKANDKYQLDFRLGSFKAMIEKRFPDLYRAVWESTTRLTHL